MSQADNPLTEIISITILTLTVLPEMESSFFEAMDDLVNQKIDPDFKGFIHGIIQLLNKENNELIRPKISNNLLSIWDELISTLEMESKRYESLAPIHRALDEIGRASCRERV